MKYIHAILVLLGVYSSLYATGTPDHPPPNNDPPGTTNAVQDMLWLAAFPWNEPITTNTFGEQFEFHLQQKLLSVPRRSVHPFNTMVNLLTPDTVPEVDAHRARIGIALSRDVTLTTFREVLRDSSLLQRLVDANPFIGSVVRDSVGNTDEQILGNQKILYIQDETKVWESVSGVSRPVDTNDIAMSYSRLQQAFHARYGLRWNYAYTTLALGRNKQQPLVFLDMRFYYGDVALGDISGSHAEVVCGIPVASRTSVTLSCNQEVDLSDWDRRIQLRLNHRLDGIHVFTGVTVRTHNQHEDIRYTFGLERRW